MSAAAPAQSKSAGVAGRAVLWRRLGNSAVAWSWGMSALRVASGVVLLPIIAWVLDPSDLGFFYVVNPWLIVVTVLDFGLAVSIERTVSYAMGGAKEIQEHGVHPADGQPNYPLLWRVVQATRAYYAMVAVAGCIGLSTIGSWILAAEVAKTTQPTVSWLAWGVVVVNASLELYAGWWSIVLRGMNSVLTSARIVFFCQAVKILLAGELLLLGGGLISMFAAGLVSSVLMRWLCRRACLRQLPVRNEPGPTRAEIMQVLRALWPNSWRVAIQLFSVGMATTLYAKICSSTFGLVPTGSYGLSVQISSLAQSVAIVWVAVKWPVVGQLRARHDFAALRQVLWPRFVLQSATFLSLALAALALGPFFLHLIRAKAEFLPRPWFGLLLACGFLELQVNFWTSLLATENRIPSVWPVAITNALSVIAVLIVSRTTSLGLATFAVVPLLAGALFNYWYWPIAGARSLGTTWLGFLTRRGGTGQAGHASADPSPLR
ncbi:MAG TPA: hypothetical protein VNM37_24625 [Candidatus Dormibacteraeota bacterium]|nr:hypothetical protein [Candidatus Dormibacteraeota bacterium]